MSIVGPLPNDIENGQVNDYIPLGENLQWIIDQVNENSVSLSSVQLGTYNEGSAGAVNRTIKNKLQEVISAKDFGATGNGITDDTIALTKFFSALTSNSFGLIPAGIYLYTPVISSGTGIGYLNLVGLSNCHIFGYGATIKNSFVVTASPSTPGTLYGVHAQSCTDSSIHGLRFDGNRDFTFGTNGDGNEFYSGFYITGCTRFNLFDCEGVNCQGDGISTNRISGNTGFNNDCGITRGFCGSNRRNEISVGGDYGMAVVDVTLFGSSDAHRTNPMSGIDVEWEHATIGPTGNNTRILLDGLSMSGTMAGAGIYIPNTSGVTVSNCRTYGLAGASVTIDNTHTGSYETQNINIHGNTFDSGAGVNIVGGANISVKGNFIKASLPFIVNSALTSSPFLFVADIDGNYTEGESTFAIKVLSGRVKFTNNMCLNCSSGGGNNYMALFRTLCEVRGNTFTRDSNQVAPTYGLVFCVTGSVFEDNSIRSIGTNVTHSVSYGDNLTPAYPSSRTNYYNGNLLADLMTIYPIYTGMIDCSSPDPQLLYTPIDTEIVDVQSVVGSAGSNVVSTTTLSIGTASNATLYLNAMTVSQFAVDGSPNNLTGSFASLNTTTEDAIFATVTPGNNAPKLQLAFSVWKKRATLYTATVLFS